MGMGVGRWNANTVRSNFGGGSGDVVAGLAVDVGISADLKGVLKVEDMEFLAESAYADSCRPDNPLDCRVAQTAKLYKSLI